MNNLAASPIFLIGIMASGKTTLGQAAAQVAGLPFVDLDAEVERRAGMTVTEIFAAEGESGFRQRERMALEEICRCGRQSIVACGGGTPCQPGLMDLMLRSGIVVWLQASTPRLVSRILSAPGQRPLVASANDEASLTVRLEELLASRSPHYSRAHLRFPSDRLEDARQISETVNTFLHTLHAYRTPRT